MLTSMDDSLNDCLCQQEWMGSLVAKWYYGVDWVVFQDKNGGSKLNRHLIPTVKVWNRTQYYSVYV